MKGTNLSLAFQAKSATSSGNFKDRLEVKISDPTRYNEASINPSDWDEVKLKNLDTNKDSLSFLVSTRVENFQYKFVDSLVQDAEIYIAFRLVTPADKGDRISIDNILVTSGIPASVRSSSTGSVSVYPNPAEEGVTLFFQQALSGSAEVSFVSTTGEVVKQAYLGTITSGLSSKYVDVSGLASGFYLIKMQTPSGLFTGKMIKK